MTPQQAYEKRYAHVDGGSHTWEAAAPHVKDLWMAAWTIAWAIAEETERDACARACEQHGSTLTSCVWVGDECAGIIRARGQA